VKEALGIYERLNDELGQARSLRQLAHFLQSDGRLDPAEGAASQVIVRFSGQGEHFQVCGCHRILGEICCSKGETEKAINHFETALGITSSFNWQSPLFWTHYSLAELFFNKGSFDEAHIHIERAKSYALNDTYNLGRAGSCRFDFGTGGRSSERQGPQPRTLLTFLRGLGLWKM
jgi:tetratricopeptide (TPR) repeat protein